MTTLVAMVGVGAVSYLFRAAPLLLLGRVRLGERLEGMIRHASAAALTALLVGAVRHSGSGAPSAAVIVATVVSLVLAGRGASLLQVVAAGSLVYATISVVGGVSG